MVLIFLLPLIAAVPRSHIMHGLHGLSGAAVCGRAVASPDGAFLLVSWLNRPFSTAVPAGRFPVTLQVCCTRLNRVCPIDTVVWHCWVYWVC
jgi:hypothetical protein